MSRTGYVFQTVSTGSSKNIPWISLFNMSTKSRHVIMTFVFECVKIIQVLSLHVSFDVAVSMIVTLSALIKVY